MAGLSLKNICKVYPNGFQAVKDFNLEIADQEFIIFLKDLKDDAVIEREASRVAGFFKDFTVGTYTKYSPTASIGAAIFPRDGSDYESMYKAADTALYKAKRRGKNQLAFFSETTEEDRLEAQNASKPKPIDSEM